MHTTHCVPRLFLLARTRRSSMAGSTGATASTVPTTLAVPPGRDREVGDRQDSHDRVDSRIRGD